MPCPLSDHRFSTACSPARFEFCLRSGSGAPKAPPGLSEGIERATRRHRRTDAVARGASSGASMRRRSARARPSAAGDRAAHGTHGVGRTTESHARGPRGSDRASCAMTIPRARMKTSSAVYDSTAAPQSELDEPGSLSPLSTSLTWSCMPPRDASPERLPSTERLRCPDHHRITLYAQKVLKTSRRSRASGAASGQGWHRQHRTACKTDIFKVAKGRDVLGQLRTSRDFWR